MRSQSTGQEKSWHLQTHLICDRCCVLVNSFFLKSHCDNYPHVTTSPGLPYTWDITQEECEGADCVGAWTGFLIFLSI